MLSIKNIHLSKKQKSLVRRICTYQISSLQEILNPLQAHAIMYEVANELELGSIAPHAQMDLEEWTKVFENPNVLPTLSSDNMSIFKHILFTYVHKLPKTKANLWRKIFLMERVTENTGLN